NSPVIVVDQYSGFDVNADTHDGTHPNISGEQKMAQKWLDALTSILDADSSPTATPTNTPLPTATPTTAPVACTNSTMLFVAQSTSLSTSDQLLVDHLTNLGHQVVIQSQGASGSGDATGKDLVIISDSVSSTQVNTKFRDVDVPVITWESGLFDDMDMATTSDYDNNQTQITITNDSHPLSANLSGTITTVSSPTYFFWGIPAANAIKIATLTTDSEKSAIFAYDTGDPMISINAPSRRVALYNGSADIYTTEAWQIFDSVVDWALSCNGSIESLSIQGMPNSMSTPVPATETPLSIDTPAPTDTPVPPTETPVPTATPISPTDTPIPTVTPVPPTETPIPTATLIPPTETPIPTATLIPPTETPIPTDTPIPPTETPLPTSTPLATPE
ncbi:MAG: hypothetical protein KDJ65_24930, partial [Anaerolineae bacterium]|nr:hypothetical protein [Anaerolineae bacterium]